ncbi:MAG: hypothetical protein SH856_03260 [Flavobacteriales bacterium]|nr:hypothetical protein [Flavobacteriales bacterium]
MKKFYFFLIMYSCLLIQACTDNHPKAIESIVNYYEGNAAKKEEAIPIYEVAELELIKVGASVVDSARLSFTEFNFNRYAKMREIKGKQVEDAELKIEVQEESNDSRYTTGEVNVDQLRSEMTAYGDSVNMMSKRLETIRQRLASAKGEEKKFYRAMFFLNKTIDGSANNATESTTLLMDENFKVLDGAELMRE